MQLLALGVFVLFFFLVLAYQGASLSVWTLFCIVTLSLYTVSGIASWWGTLCGWSLFLVCFVPLNYPFLRQKLFSRYALKIFRQLKPTMSRTEREALEAGTVGWEGALFTGRPDWQALLNQPKPILTEKESAFIAGPLEELCRMIDNWDIVHQRFDLPPDIWQFLKDNGFFGLIIPEEYGGKEFSACAHTVILTKVAGRSTAVATTITVPNSLGPAELILQYGTKEQKDFYLPRLAKGKEIPCFALTSAEAGSDAAAIPDAGIVCKGMFQGKEVLGIRLNWDKRYITLAPVATVVGLAFRLFDPELLLGNEVDIGITCALIPATLPGIKIGRRHFPMNIAFQNGPIQGKDVFIPLDYIIGGVAQAGNGWRMLMECLAAGRVISLPFMSLGCAKSALASTAAYARIRRQFSAPIAYFEGIEEVLTRMAGVTYIMNALGQLSIGQVMLGQKPAVAAAIAKYHMTEMGRQMMIDSMDVHAGKGICLGPRNYVGRGYQAAPISITVEGANILTRSLIIFGQGAIRCHPYILDEMLAAAESDEASALARFDKAFFAHMGFILSNKIYAFGLALTKGRLARVPKGICKRYFQYFSRFSAAFALLADVCMITMGAELKRKEKISGRLGDILSLLYMGSSVLKQFHEDGEPAADVPLLDWTCQYILHQIETRLSEVLQNLPNRWVAMSLKCIIFPWGLNFPGPNDVLGHEVAKLVVTSCDSRDRLIAGIDLTPDKYNCIGNMEATFNKAIQLEETEKRLLKAKRNGELNGLRFMDLIQEAFTRGILSPEEAEQLKILEKERQEIIAVDDFETDELKPKFCS